MPRIGHMWSKNREIPFTYVGVADPKSPYCLKFLLKSMSIFKSRKQNKFILLSVVVSEIGAAKS